MVKPLWPPQYPTKKPPSEQLWKNPHLIGATTLILILMFLAVYHFTASDVIDPMAGPGNAKKGVFSFLEPSKYIISDTEALKLQQEKLLRMGISTESSILQQKVQTKNMREQRQMMAIRKYEAGKEMSEKFQQERNNLRRRLSSGASRQLKDAIMALEDSSNLGIMKLERLLEEKFHSSGAESKDLDVLIFAYENLAKAYEKKNMLDKAKDAYINVFSLLKKQAPDSQGLSWNNAIENVEKLSSSKSPRDN